MPSFSVRSAKNLASADERLQRLFNCVIEHMDCTVICGHRSVSEQRELYSIGRSMPGHKVTHIDGLNRLSRHNYKPSLAVDTMRYPIKWDDTEYNKEFAMFVKGVAVGLGIEVEWGGDWSSFQDYPHWQVAQFTER